MPIVSGATDARLLPLYGMIKGCSKVLKYAYNVSIYKNLTHMTIGLSVPCIIRKSLFTCLKKVPPRFRVSGPQRGPRDQGDPGVCVQGRNL